MLTTLLIFSVFGALGRGADIDINRIKRISNQVPVYPEESVHANNDRLIIKTNDYDDHSWYQLGARASLPFARDTVQASDSKSPVQINQPRQDPRSYYQSDAYLKKYGRKNVNEEVTFVYPGRHVVQAGENYARPYSRIRSNEVETFSAALEDLNICVKCPHDRTLVAKASFGRVVLQNPLLLACSGRKAPRNVRFEHMYGPKMGSLLEEGSHVIIGRIMYKNKSLQFCKMQVHVITQDCVTPTYLKSRCWDQNKRCNFTCANKHFELSGPTTQVCEDMKWKGELPICKLRTWCELPPPPEHGRVSCQGATAGNDTGLTEGSRCRVKCARGFRSNRVTPVCRRGAWTHALVCQPKRERNERTNNPNSPNMAPKQ